MTFRVTSQQHEEYRSVGLIVMRGLIPAALLSDLRREADKAREIARRRSGAQVQRLQPVYAYEDLDQQPFRDFLALPALREAVEQILSPQHRPTENMGILLEPAEKAWCTNWHRDWGHHVPNLDMDYFFEKSRNLQMFNQLNGALYDDHSLWVVPGSHNREDTPEEREAFGSVPAPSPMLTDEMTPTERELICTEYARRMPGATQIVLKAGDVAFYRACGWHIGSYVPYTRRATLHDGFYGPEDYAWQNEMTQLRERQKQA